MSTKKRMFKKSVHEDSARFPYVRMSEKKRMFKGLATRARNLATLSTVLKYSKEVARMSTKKRMFKKNVHEDNAIFPYVRMSKKKRMFKGLATVESLL